jgi:pyridinium-3,5-bisthiocarboxylic acid mononucleotide nickel chelatase
MRVLFVDCIGGISGDMALGALVDAGADLDEIRKLLSTLPIEPFEISGDPVDVHGIAATKITVASEAAGVIRTYASIRSLLDGSDLPSDAKLLSQRIFHKLAEAEAVVHRRDIEHVAFHEVGAVDSIVDICGAAIAFTQLSIDRAFCSAVPTGLGTVRTEHGIMPLPAPAVVQLLQGVPMYSRDVPLELVTPTGAAIVATVSEGFGPMPSMRTELVGYGAGTHRTDVPNLLRVMIGEATGSNVDAETGPLTQELVLQTNLDDLNPELLGYVVERLFEAGAQDAWLTPIIMKKGRPAVTISVLCSPVHREAIRRVLFRETGTLGIRATAVEKLALERAWLEVRTAHGDVRVKVGRLDGIAVSVAPEYEDCAAVARVAGVPAREVYEEAGRLARAQLSADEEP